MKIVIGTNLLTEVNASVYANHCAFYYHLGRIAQERNWQIFTVTPNRMGIDKMRNMCAKFALEQECDYLVFIDDDMLIHPRTVEALVDCNKDIVMAHTYIRGYPFEPMAFVRKDREKDIRNTHLIHYSDVVKDSIGDLTECDAIGFATVAIKTHLLKDLPPPWFVTTPSSTEDVYFCLRCKMELKYDVGIYVHMGVPTSHKLDNEFVGEENVELLRNFYKPAFEKAKQREDRTEEYHEMVSKL